MVISDHLNLTGRNPLEGEVLPGETRFPDMTVAYDAGLREIAHRVAVAQGTELAEGVYAALLGPTYETPAEIRMLERLGADAVGMSTAPETIVARARGMRVLGFSTITNAAAGISQELMSHADVMKVADAVAGRLADLVEAIVARDWRVDVRRETETSSQPLTSYRLYVLRLTSTPCQSGPSPLPSPGAARIAACT